MALVVNNIVKMEWEKSGWLQTSSKNGRQPVFVFASKNYERSDGEGSITVFFTADTAFLVISNQGEEDEDLWSAEEFIPVIKKDIPGNFPFSMEEYYSIIDDNGDVDVDILEKYGITEYKEDIEARRRDIEPYGHEVDVEM